MKEPTERAVVGERWRSVFKNINPIEECTILIHNITVNINFFLLLFLPFVSVFLFFSPVFLKATTSSKDTFSVYAKLLIMKHTMN